MLVMHHRYACAAVCLPSSSSADRSVFVEFADLVLVFIRNSHLTSKIRIIPLNLRHGARDYIAPSTFTYGLVSTVRKQYVRAISEIGWTLLLLLLYLGS